MTQPGGGETGVVHGKELLGFADAAISGDAASLAAARTAVIEALGIEAMHDAAAVIGGFDGITRIADATGIPVEPAKAESAADFVAALGIGRFQREKV